MAVNDKLKTKPVQVKTIRDGSWQFDVRKFLDISISKDGSQVIQVIHGKKRLENRDLNCIFVKLVSQGRDEFYIFRLQDLQDIIFKRHSEWLPHNGVRS